MAECYCCINKNETKKKIELLLKINWESWIKEKKTCQGEGKRYGILFSIVLLIVDFLRKVKEGGM